MAQKRKSARPQSKLAALDPNVVMLAILTAILDPEEVRRDLSAGRLPSSFSLARELIEKIDNFLKGGEERSRVQLFDLEVAEELENTIPEPLNSFIPFDTEKLIKQLYRERAMREWRLEEGQKFNLAEATKQAWCGHGVKWLKKLLERHGFPFDCSNGKLCLTQAAYEMALMADSERRRKLDLGRRALKRKQKREISREKKGQKIVKKSAQ